MKVVYSAEGLTRRVQRLILTPGQLAPEYKPADISPVFKANGSTEVDDDAYRAHLCQRVQGLAAGGRRAGRARSACPSTTCAQRPGRTQITRHDCVEGWSCIGKWTGARLGPILMEAGLKPAAKFIVFYCADTIDALAGTQYYESIGLADAFHPQTLLAYAMNDQPLPGAPRRAAAPAGGAPTRLQTGQVRDEDRGGGQPGPHQWRQGRLLGGFHRLRMVRRNLEGGATEQQPH